MTTSTTGPKRKEKQIRLWAVGFWLTAWQLAAMAMDAWLPHGELLLASPVAVLGRLGALCVTGAFWITVARSTLRIIGGFFLGSFIGAALAALAARFVRVRELLAPLVAAVKAVPVMSFIILALLWVPTEELSLFIAFLMVFPPIYLNVLEGIAHTDRSLLEMARVFRVPGARRLRDLYLPQVLPFFRSAASLALGLCWKAGVAAEVIGAVRWTLGERLYSAKIYLETADLFAWTVTIVCVSVLFERLFLHLLDAAVRKVGA